MEKKKENKTTINPRKEQKLVNNTPKTIKKPKADKPKKPRTELTIKERAFVREYIKTGNATQSIKQAGYKCKNDNAASSRASQLLRKSVVKAEIERLMKPKEKKAIMDAQEVMELFSAIARGEVKDQFGLDATLNDRLKAMNEIAKRTIDIDNRIKGIPDNAVTIKVDWRKS